LSNGLPLRREHALVPQLPRQHRRRADPDEPLEDHAQRRGIGLLNQQLPVLDPVAERHLAAHEHALLPRRPDLVAHPLGDHLALELGEAQSRMLSVSRPIEVVVLNDWVTETKVTPWRSKISTSFEKSISERDSRSIL
jgi:hypothetical protein